ncbi:Uncharacterised protein [Legionella busanensis]|uniref:Uncharacterized protein n=1 Tax=Legionella busanensis TaxID=190655 RepID=A0A378JJT9_9GAMM|nr:hypothetical protein [Legionella busanensis]STX50430.1 Uncharacterised protein [Legionella busanensis]
MYSKHTNATAKFATFFQLKNVNQINQQALSRDMTELQNMKGLLNSQRIKLLFGHYGIELIFQEDNIRISNLHSNGIMRTCAIVNFSLPIPVWLKNTHNKIYHGSSIGQTIKDQGFELTKGDVYFGVVNLPKAVKDKMETDEDLAAVHIYQLLVKNPETSQSLVYCTISEVHSPLYFTLEDLRQLNPESQKNSNLTELGQKSLKELSTLDQYFTLSKANQP